MSLVAEDTAVLQTGGSPDVPHHVVVILDALRLHPVAAGAGGAGGDGGAPGAARPVDGVDGPVLVRHEVARHGEVRPEAVGEQAVVLAVGGVAVAEGVAEGLAVTAGRAVLQGLRPHPGPDQAGVVVVQTLLQAVAI